METEFGIRVWLCTRLTPHPLLQLETLYSSNDWRFCALIVVISKVLNGWSIVAGATISITETDYGSRG